VVVVREDRPGDRRLVAYVVEKKSGGGVSGAELREYLRERLPEYMVPSVYEKLGELPLTASGKVDRQSCQSRRREREKGKGEENRRRRWKKRWRNMVRAVGEEGHRDPRQLF